MMMHRIKDGLLAHCLGMCALVSVLSLFHRIQPYELPLSSSRFLGDFHWIKSLYLR